jgi:hypothetical protein
MPKVKNIKDVEKIVKKMIQPKSFVRVNTDELKDDVGLAKGDRLYVDNLRAIPEDPNDPYTQRVKLITAKLEKGHILSDQLFLIDPSRVAKVGTKEQETLMQNMIEDFSNPVSDEATVDEAAN